MARNVIQNAGQSYIGVRATTPAQLIQQPRDPLPSNLAQMQRGTEWLNTITKNKFYLAAFTNTGSGPQAVWVKIQTGSGTNVETLTGNSGGAVSPASNNINVVGDGTTITVVGNPGTNTLTISTVGAVSDSFVTDSGTATPSAGVLNVKGGAAARDINTSGSGSTIHIDLNNAITLGDLSTIAAGSPVLTLNSGDILLEGSNQAAATNQMIRFKTNSGQDGNISMFLNNIFMGQQAGNTTMTPGTAIFNIGIGTFSGSSITTATQNVGVGNAALQSMTTGQNNLALGYTALDKLTTGSGNVGIGSGALGAAATSGITTGSFNIAIGNVAGSNYMSSESSNILIGYNLSGTLGESNVLRIGNATGAADGNLSASYIQGIAGVTVSSSAAVLINTITGQLGTISSSARYKENIWDLEDQSSLIMKMRPVLFNYKQEQQKDIHYGLLAEEVYELMPELVNLDKEGRPDNVKYHEMTALLLNEIQKLEKRIALLESK